LGYARIIGRGGTARTGAALILLSH
jgi:hypothetical protein